MLILFGFSTVLKTLLDSSIFKMMSSRFNNELERYDLIKDATLNSKMLLDSSIFKKVENNNYYNALCYI